MATPANDLLEVILRECLAAGGRPWYPANYVKATGVDRRALDAALDRLRLAGLLLLTDWVKDLGQGYVLTEVGAEVAQSPRLLERLRHGDVPEPVKSSGPEARRDNTDPSDRYQAVRDALLNPNPPRVTFILLAINLLVFLAGLAQCWNDQNKFNAYLNSGILVGGQGVPNGANNRAAWEVNELRHDMGSLARPDIVGKHEYWRLVSHAFGHIGFIHLLVNMYMLFSLGPMIERMWGSGRYLILYLLSAIGGGLAGILFQGEAGMMGASGALCGLLGSMLIWVWLNRRYLGSSLSSEWLRSIVINIILIGLISMVPGVSWSGHLGGGVVGIVLAVPMVYHRFGTQGQRLLGLCGIVLMPLVLYGVLEWQLAQRSDVEKARDAYGVGTERARETAVKALLIVEPVMVKASLKEAVPAADVQRAFVEADRARAELQGMIKHLQSAPKYDDPRVNRALEISEQYLKSWDLFFATARDSLDNKGHLKPGKKGELESRGREMTALHAQYKDTVLVKPSP